jgi:hypothetical protein
MKIINLDSILADDQQIVLDGKEWIIPGEISVDQIFKLIGLQQKIQEDPLDFDSWDRQLQVVHQVFKKRQPDLEFEELKNMLSARQLGKLIGILMASIGETELTEEEKKRLQESREENQ